MFHRLGLTIMIYLAVKPTLSFVLRTSNNPFKLSAQRSSKSDDDEMPTWWDDSRRRFLVSTSASLLASSLLASHPVRAYAADSKTVVVTGANSGIGYEASARLVEQGHKVVLACRTATKAQETAARIQQETGLDSAIPLECDLAKLESIKSFVNELSEKIGSEKLGAVCLNAGVARNTAATDVARTADGFELTVGTNHFGHFYLNHLLLPMISPTGRIIVTASSVHDPESPGGAQGVPATLGEMEGLEKLGKSCEMIDGGAFNADKAYKDSKLCNVLFTRELQRRLEADERTKNIVANSFSPGLIVGTGLFRDQNKFFTTLFDIAATNLLKVGETPPWGGGCLAYMVNAVTDRGQFYNSPPGSSKYGEDAYGREFTQSNVSKEAQDDQKARRLWELSERELGLV